MRDDDPESSDAVTPGREGHSRAVVAELDRARALAAGTGLRRPRSRQWLGSRRRQSLAGVVLLAAVGYIAYQGLTSASQYFLTTKQAVAQRSSLGARPFRIEGTVDDDVRQSGGVIDFDITADDVTVPVVSTGSPTSLFRPGIPVVLIGHWQGGYYASNQIMVKHTSSYVEAHPSLCHIRGAHECTGHAAGSGS